MGVSLAESATAAHMVSTHKILGTDVVQPGLLTLELEMVEKEQVGYWAYAHWNLAHMVVDIGMAAIEAAADETVL